MPLKPTVSFVVPVKTVSESNHREHWRSRADRAKAQRSGALERALSAVGGLELSLPVVVRLTRYGVKTLDDDNLAGALKGVRDGIAEWLGVDDGDRSRVQYLVEQITSPRELTGVEVEVFARCVVDTRIRRVKK